MISGPSGHNRPDDFMISDWKPESSINLVGNFAQLNDFLNNHCETYLRLHNGGEKGLTVEGMCEAIAKLKFNPGECHYLENIDVQVRNFG